MRINILTVLLACACLALPACDNTSKTPKSAVVDLGRLMRESAPGKDGMVFIEAQQKEMQAQLDEIQDRLEKNPQDEAAMQELQKVYALSQQRIQTEGQNIAGQILDVVQRTLNNYRAANGYDVILLTDSLAAYDPALDITNAVLAEVNKQKIEFKPTTQNQSESAQSDEAASEPAAIVNQPEAKPEQPAPASKPKK